MTNEETREVINELLQTDDEVLIKIFGTYNLSDIFGDYHICDIKGLIDDFNKPKYGDVYVDKTNDKEKVIFLSKDYTGECWVLFKHTPTPQQFSTPSFEKYYTKTDNNVADVLKGLFE